MKRPKMAKCYSWHVLENDLKLSQCLSGPFVHFCLLAQNGVHRGGVNKIDEDRWPWAFAMVGLLVNPLSWFLFPKLAPSSLKRLPKQDLIRFHTYITSICHGIFASISGLLCAYELAGSSSDHAYFGHSTLAVNVCEVFMAYLLQDLGILLYHYNALRDKESIFHHTIFLAISQYTVANSYFVWPFAWLILGEMSTPFLGIRWILAVSGNKASQLYFYNGILLATTFFLFRGVLYGYGLYDMFRNYSVWGNVPGLNVVAAGLTVVYGLNLLWLSRIIAGARRALIRNSKSP